jgi:hypothetical protein
MIGELAGNLIFAFRLHLISILILNVLLPKGIFFGSTDRVSFRRMSSIFKEGYFLRCTTFIFSSFAYAKKPVPVFSTTNT